ncbi:MAG: hypothetical protein MUE94_13895 [Verrucomicrobia bacterium]|jgi:hypothetical protein|nr:hypothetical protein [Verrucomicrobiota bacterium]
MKMLILFLLWCVLFVLSWPVAIAALILLPLLWLLSIPFRMLGWLVEATLALIKSILFLPARLLGHKTTP